MLQYLVTGCRSTPRFLQCIVLPLVFFMQKRKIYPCFFLLPRGWICVCRRVCLRVRLPGTTLPHRAPAKFMDAKLKTESEDILFRSIKKPQRRSSRTRNAAHKRPLRRVKAHVEFYHARSGAIFCPLAALAPAAAAARKLNAELTYPIVLSVAEK